MASCPKAKLRAPEARALIPKATLLKPMA